MSNLKSTLERLSKLTTQNTKTGTESSVKYWKAKHGKNNLIVLPSPETGDPFLTWGEHKNLQDVSWKTVPCDKQNKNTECIVCQVIDDLKKQNWKGNFSIWKPIEQSVRYFSPVIDLDDLDAGIQWWGYGKSVLGQFENWLLNLEGDETPFYDLSAPEKVVVNYDKDADPALKYKLEHKPLKNFPEGLEEMAKGIKPLVEIFTFRKTKDELAELLETYMTKIEAGLETEGTSEEEEEEETPVTTNTPIKKLDALKKK